MQANTTQLSSWLSRQRVLIGWVAVALSGMGCSGNQAAPQAAQGGPARRAFVAQPCAGLELGAEPLDPKDARVFVEVAELNTRALPRPIGRWLQLNAVQVRSKAQLVAFPNVPTSVPWGQCVDSVCSSTKLAITLTARLPELASGPLELALQIQEPAPQGSDSGPHVLLETTLEALNQEPVVLPKTEQLTEGSVVVTAYLLRRHDDLHRVLECQAQQDEREKASR